MREETVTSLLQLLTEGCIEGTSKITEWCSFEVVIGDDFNELTGESLTFSKTGVV